MDQITTSNWQAWINAMPGQPNPGGTLNIKGDVDTHSQKFAFLQKRNSQGINLNILILDLQVHMGTIPAINPQHVSFSEVLAAGHFYNAIEIYFNGALETRIDDIPIIQ